MRQIDQSLKCRHRGPVPRRRRLQLEALEARWPLALPASYLADVRIEISYMMSIEVDGRTSTMSENLASRTMPLLSNASEYQLVADGLRRDVGPVQDEAEFSFESGGGRLSGRNELAYSDNKPGLVNSMWVLKSTFGEDLLGAKSGSAVSSIDVRLTVLPNADYPAGSPVSLRTIFVYESFDGFLCNNVDSFSCVPRQDSTLSVSAKARFESGSARAPFELNRPASEGKEIFDLGGPNVTALVGAPITLKMEQSITGILTPEDEFRRASFFFNVLTASPPPDPTLQVVRDGQSDGPGHLMIDETDPVTDHVRIGLWNNAYDAIGTFDELHQIRNRQSESGNFVGSDSERFYFRVTDHRANLDPDQQDAITIDWYTATASGDDLDREGNTSLTLLETDVSTGVFVSKAVMLVAKSTADVDGDGEADDVDWRQPTHTGMDDGGEAGPGQANHRTRRAAIGSQVVGKYSPSRGNSAPVTTSATVFREQERRYLPLTVISFVDPTTNRPYVNDDIILQHFRVAQELWMPAAITLRPRLEYAPVPLAALRPQDNRLVFHAESDPHRAVMEQFILAKTADDPTALVVLFGPNLWRDLAFPTAQTWASSELASAIGQRGVIYMSPRALPSNGTFAHELFHALYNREDVRATQAGNPEQFDVEPHYITFNTSQSTDYLSNLPDVRVRRRLHPSTVDWETPGGVWSHRPLPQRFEPRIGPSPPADQTTGNSHLRSADVPALTLSIEPGVAAIEGDSGFVNIEFFVSLSGGPIEPVTVDYATSDSTARHADDDYVRSIGSLTFNIGETTKAIPVSIRGDERNENGETFLVKLSNAQGATIAADTAFGFIINDDQDQVIALWQNPRVKVDVNDDGSVSARDALLIINEMAALGGASDLGPRPANSNEPYFDVNGDGRISALDALLVINQLGRTASTQSSEEFAPLNSRVLTSLAIDHVLRESNTADLLRRWQG